METVIKSQRTTPADLGVALPKCRWWRLGVHSWRYEHGKDYHQCRTIKTCGEVLCSEKAICTSCGLEVLL